MHERSEAEPRKSILPQGEQFDGADYCTDKALPPDQLEEAARRAAEENPDNAIPDGPKRLASILDGTAPPEVRIALATKKKWAPGRKLKVRLDGGTDRLRERVAHYAGLWSQHANIGFEFVTSGQAEIRVAFVIGDGSWSYIGTDALLIKPDKPTMNYGWLTDTTSEEELRRVIVHEFGHAIGAIHEHQHPAGGIPWDEEAVYAYYARTNGWDRKTVENNIFAKYKAEQLNASEYDPESIMHYAVPAALLTDPSRAVGWNTDLSDRDKSFIATAYPKA